jgi:hypothetical protein
MKRECMDCPKWEGERCEYFVKSGKDCKFKEKERDDKP